MPQHNCSDLQRFAQNCDISRVMYPNYPELGPVYWTGTTTGGLMAKPRKAALPRLKALDDFFPIFSLGGHRYSAMRWLYFQLYDDRNRFGYDTLANSWLTQRKPGFMINKKMRLGYTKIDDDGKRVKYHRDEKGRIQHELSEDQWIYTVEEMPNGNKPFFNCSHQEWVAVYWYSHGVRETIQKDGTQPTISKSASYREWNEMFWSDRRFYMTGMLPASWMRYSKDLSRSMPQHGDREMNQKPWTWDNDTQQFQRVQLVFPEYVGYDRIKLVRHYLLGGTDADRPAPTETIHVNGVPFHNRVTDDWIDWCKTMNWRYEEDTY